MARFGSEHEADAGFERAGRYRVKHLGALMALLQALAVEETDRITLAHLYSVESEGKRRRREATVARRAGGTAREVFHWLLEEAASLLAELDEVRLRLRVYLEGQRTARSVVVVVRHGKGHGRQHSGRAPPPVRATASGGGQGLPTNSGSASVARAGSDADSGGDHRAVQQALVQRTNELLQYAQKSGIFLAKVRQDLDGFREEAGDRLFDLEEAREGFDAMGERGERLESRDENHAQRLDRIERRLNKFNQQLRGCLELIDETYQGTLRGMLSSGSEEEDEDDEWDESSW